jgi:hypothetical protein
MNIPLTKSAWKASDLDGQSVQFRVPDTHDTMIGIGKFLAADCPGGLLSLSIVVDLTVRAGLEWKSIRIPIPQIGVDCIQVHNDQTIARYSLFVV